MASGIPRQRSRGTRLPVSDRRRGIVYGFWVVHPLTGQRVLGYVGQTRQALRAREAQHRAEQPWADTIVGPAVVIAEGAWTNGELDAHEVRQIQALRPLYNIDHNRTNPNRILPWDAVAQRQAREPGWQPPTKNTVRIPRQRGPIPSSRVRHRSALARWWARHRRQVIKHGVLWLAMYIAASWLASHVLSERHTVIAGAVVATVLYAAITKRWWRRATSPTRTRGRRR